MMVKKTFPSFLRGGAGAGLKSTDARLKLISKHRANMTDARDQLARIAKTTDARNKIQKIRNLKQGKLEVKQTSGGAVTITKTTKGNILLTTKKKQAKTNVVSQHGSLTKRVGKGGAISISTKKKVQARPGQNARAGQNAKVAQGALAGLRKAVVGTTSRASRNNVKRPVKPLTRTIKGELTEAARLDAELMNTHVDPIILKRTVRQNIRDSPPERRYVPTRTLSPDRYYDDRRRDRSRSPLGMDYDDYRPQRRRGYNDFDDPRRRDEEELQYRRRMQQEPDYDSLPTMGDRAENGGSFQSPLQGVKVVVSNLQNSVSQEDIMELFGDIGPLKRAKLVEIGTAEVVFVTKADAQRAVEVYHNRQLDGRAMKCHLVGNTSASGTSVPFRLSGGGMPTERDRPRYAAPDMTAIHKALFDDRRGGRTQDRPVGQGKPLFSMKGGR